MGTSYKVRVWDLQKRYRAGDNEKKAPSRYVVRWKVDVRPFQESFKTRALADSFRSELVAAARNGEGFDAGTGRPVSQLRPEDEAMSWYDFARTYSTVRWDELAPGSRRNLVNDLTAITTAMMNTDRGRPETKLLHKALRTALNVKKAGEYPVEISTVIRWVERHSRQVRELEDPDVIRSLIGALDKKLDGTRAAPDTVRLRRTTLTHAIEHAIEKRLLNTNPLRRVKTRKNKTALREVDLRAVINPTQARTLLGTVKVNNRRFAAFFALMYFAALRPEEVVNLRKRNLSIPEKGWGELHLEGAAPEIGEEWTDSGVRSEERALKHREAHESRTVPCCPELTAFLHDHLRLFTPEADGRLFWGERSRGRVPSSVYCRIWAQARAHAFTPEVYASPLVKRPYDLRHAAVSTWLTAGVEVPRVAQWAGHSQAVLIRVYSKFLDGGESAALRRIEERLGPTPSGL